jgi:hypothetical protein
MLIIEAVERPLVKRLLAVPYRPYTGELFACIGEVADYCLIVDDHARGAIEGWSVSARRWPRHSRRCAIGGVAGLMDGCPCLSYPGSPGQVSRRVRTRDQRNP